MPPRPTPPRPTLAKPEKPKKKPSKKPSRKPQRRDVGTISARGMLPKSRAITATRRAIMPSIIPSQKTSDRWPSGTLQHALCIWCQVQGDKTRALTDVGSKEIDGSALKTCKKVTAGVSLQDGREDQRGGDLATAPVSQRHSGVFKLCKLRIETPLTLVRQNNWQIK